MEKPISISLYIHTNESVCIRVCVSFGPDELADVTRSSGDALPGCCTGSFARALAPAGCCTSYGGTHCLYVCLSVCMYV